MPRSDPCPHCGAPVPAGRPACPECGSDAETGWNEDALDGVSATDVPDTFDDEAYLDAIADLPGADRRGRGPRTRRQSVLLATGLIAILALLGAFVLRSYEALVVLASAAVLILLFASPVRRRP